MELTAKSIRDCHSAGFFIIKLVRFKITREQRDKQVYYNIDK